MVLKRTVGFNLTFRSVCSDRLLEKKKINSHEIGEIVYISRRRSEYTDRNVELKPAVLFRTIPTLIEINTGACSQPRFHSQPHTGSLCCLNHTKIKIYKKSTQWKFKFKSGRIFEISPKIRSGYVHAGRIIHNWNTQSEEYCWWMKCWLLWIVL